MRINYRQRNEYFATYDCFNENGEKIGIIEEHDANIKIPYFVAWTNPSKAKYGWETKSFKTREEAIKHIEENA